MKRLLAIAVALSFGSAIQAAPFEWNYQSDPTDVAVVSDGGPSSNVSFTSTSGNGIVGSSLIVLTNLASNSSIPASDPPDTFTSQPYELTLTIEDVTSATSETFVFSGSLSGTMTEGSSVISNVFDVPTTVSKDIGDYTYTVTINSFTGPGAPGTGGTGSINAIVTLEEKGGEPNETPEPSTLVLGGLGLSLLGLVRRKKA